jgi:putative ATPase
LQAVKKGMVVIMDLFDYMRNNTMEKEAPLASRLRPVTLDEVVGQKHIIGKDKLLYRAIKADKLSSIIFYGPPGTGKTTLAKVIANTTSSIFTQINATSAGKKDMEAVIEEAKDNLGRYGRRTILFIDEIHRFNKGQQDYLLPFVGDGTVILIGATTENPYFEVNSALISRSIIFELKSLDTEDIKILLKRAVNDREKGLGAYDAVLHEDALDFLADIANGDARAALNAIELGVLTTERAEDGKIHITLEDAFKITKGRMGLEGNIEIGDIMIKSQDEVIESTKNAINTGKKYNRFILCPSAGYMEVPNPPKRYIYNLLCYLKTAKECLNI